MVWKVEMCVQPLPRYVQRWCGRRCGPWRHLNTIWVDRGEDIPDRLGEAETAGLYVRLLLCCEEHKYNEDLAIYVPVDQV